MNTMSTIVIIPAYNEGTRIAEVVAGVRRVVPECRVLVIDDGSRDATAAAARGAGATVLCHPFNMGYGVAIQTGYKYAYARGYDFLVQIDGDGQHDPSFIPRLLEPVVSGATDVALGSRFLTGESYLPSRPRRIGMALFRRVVSCITGHPITDSTSGYQAFNRGVIRFFTGDVFPCDYPDADMLITLHLAGFSIREIPVRMYANAQGKSMHGGLNSLYYLFKMFLSIFVTVLRSHRLYRR
jgi:glycosyltransferase involved in cell wall biosynthesis